jgi:FlgN protein
MPPATHAPAVPPAHPSRSVAPDAPAISAKTVLLTALADAFAAERRQVETLRDTILRQRDGVARDDVTAVDDSVFAMQRTLVTLQVARRQRRAICRRIFGSEDTPLRDLDSALGADMTDALRTERDALLAAARRLARDIEINRRVLQQALHQGSALVPVLAGGAESPTYTGPMDPGTDRAAGGLVLDTRA